MKPIEVAPIVGNSVLFPPGYVSITLTPEHRNAYGRLYGLTFPLADVPELKDRDFDGHTIKMRRRQLAALNSKFRALHDDQPSGPPGPFRDQEHELTQRSKEMQFLS